MRCQNIAIMTAGSHGDVRPYVALGVGLQAAGHTVRLTAFPVFEGLIRSHGLDFWPVANPGSELSATKEWTAWQASGTDTVSFVRYFSRVARTAYALIERMFDDNWHACKSADMIIASSFGIGGPHIAERLHVPFAWALLQPMSRTHAFPHFLSPTGHRSGARVNLLTYLIAEYVFWELFKRPINRCRQRTLQLPPIARPRHYGLIGKTYYPILYGFSPTVLPKPLEWGERVNVTGYWFLDRPAGWQPPTDLQDFLDAGPPPIYIGFGSMHLQDPEATTALLLKALAMTKQRGVLLAVHGGLSHAALPDNVFAIGATPHDWLFPRMAAVVHHGGAGTTAAGLRAGVPSVILPFFADQPFWGWQVHRLGVAPRPIPFRGLTAERLAASIHAATSDTHMQHRAAAVGARIRAENGVERAVEHVYRYLAARFYPSSRDRVRTEDRRD